MSGGDHTAAPMSGGDHTAAPMSGGAGNRSLEGVRVLDLADRSAALTGRLLADLGAEVILVEPPAGNPIRRLAPFVDDKPGPERSFHHLYLNANKSSVVLDLDDPADRSRFLDLVATAQVVIDTERPGRLEELGLGHDVLAARSPGLIQISVTPHGLDTPWRHRRATDLTSCAAGGLVWISGEPKGTPVHGGATPAYAMAGLGGTSAALVALTNRERDPEFVGVHVDISLQEAAAMAVMQTATPSQWTWFDRIPRRPGLSAVLKCADGGYVGLLVRPDRFDEFLAWCGRVGIEHDMTHDDWKWSLLTAPRQGNPVVRATLDLAEALTRDEFADGALEADLVCLPVLDFDDLGHHEQFTVNRQFATIRHDGLGRELGVVRSPVDALDEEVVIGPAPVLGADQALLDGLDDLDAGAEPAGPPAAPRSSTPDTSTPDPARALDGIRVVDFGWVLAAPIGTRLLASFGAEVLRVESSRKPDSMRQQHGPNGKPDPDLGGLFNSVNAGKKSLTVDLTTEAGMELIRDLIATSDLVVNNFRPGAMERMGLGYETLRKLKDDIVLLNMPGAHRHGPWAVRSSMGNILMAASGFNMLTGFEGERPRGIGIAYPDFTSPHLLVSTALAALRQRDRTGQGQEIHLAQLSGIVGLLGVEWMWYSATGRQPPRPNNRDLNHCPHGVFPARPSEDSDDEWVAIAVAGDDQWQALCQAMGRPDLASDRRFASHADRKKHEDALDVEIAAWTATQDKWSCAERCQVAGVAAAPVEHLADTYDRDPQLRHHYQIVNQPVAPDIDVPIDREMAQWRGADHRLVRSPMLGEHNEYIVREILGRSEQNYIDLLVGEVLE
jgi:crotonobetainyl-CoA:carnitine CoA-transferase CaiB-like acyl-CoA transferase